MKRYFAAVMALCGVCMVMQSALPRIVHLVPSDNEPSRYGTVVVSRPVEVSYREKTDSLEVDIAIVDLGNVLTAVIRDDGKFVRYEFLQCHNLRRMDYDTVVAFPKDSVLMYSDRVHGRAQGTVPTIILPRIAYTDDGARDFNAYLNFSGGINYSIKELAFLNEIGVQAGIGRVYHAEIEPGITLRVDRDPRSLARQDNVVSSLPYPTITVEGEYGIVPDRPEVLDGMRYSYTKGIGDCIRMDDDRYLRIDAVADDFSSITLTPIQEFELKRIGLTDEQRELVRPYLEKAGGKYLLLDFWGTWCGPCINAMPRVKEILDRYPDKLALLGVCCDDESNFGRARELLAEKGISGMEVMQPMQPAPGSPIWHGTMGITSFPTYILLSPDGTMLLRGGVSSLFFIPSLLSK